MQSRSSRSLASMSGFKAAIGHHVVPDQRRQGIEISEIVRTDSIGQALICRSVASSARVRVSGSRCVPRFVYFIHWRLAKRLLITAFTVDAAQAFPQSKGLLDRARRRGVSGRGVRSLG